MKHQWLDKDGTLTEAIHEAQHCEVCGEPPKLADHSPCPGPPGPIIEKALIESNEYKQQCETIAAAFEDIEYVGVPTIYSDGVYMLANQRDEALDIVRELAALQAMEVKSTGAMRCPLCTYTNSMHEPNCLIQQARLLVEGYPDRRKAERRLVVERREGNRGRRHGAFTGRRT